jgi:hypothetical protein
MKTPNNLAYRDPCAMLSALSVTNSFRHGIVGPSSARTAANRKTNIGGLKMDDIIIYRYESGGRFFVEMWREDGEKRGGEFCSHEDRERFIKVMKNAIENQV